MTVSGYGIELVLELAVRYETDRSIMAVRTIHQSSVTPTCVCDSDLCPFDPRVNVFREPIPSTLVSIVRAVTL